ncbi:MAG: hypothetical protein MZU97_12405 [Bacillus subtilis]|nr:hypothetical protein [Bacillus subtilis]
MPPKGRCRTPSRTSTRPSRTRSRLINEGKEAYNQADPEGRAARPTRSSQQAEGYATERVNKARGDVARFLAVLGEYQQGARESPATRLYYEMYRRGLRRRRNRDGARWTRTSSNFLPFKTLGAAGASPSAAEEALMNKLLVGRWSSRSVVLGIAIVSRFYVIVRGRAGRGACGSGRSSGSCTDAGLKLKSPVRRQRRRPVLQEDPVLGRRGHSGFPPRRTSSSGWTPPPGGGSSDPDEVLRVGGHR